MAERSLLIVFLCAVDRTEEERGHGRGERAVELYGVAARILVGKTAFGGGGIWKLHQPGWHAADFNTYRLHVVQQDLAKRSGSAGRLAGERGGGYYVATRDMSGEIQPPALFLIMENAAAWLPGIVSNYPLTMCVSSTQLAEDANLHRQSRCLSGSGHASARKTPPGGPPTPPAGLHPTETVASPCRWRKTVPTLLLVARRRSQSSCRMHPPPVASPAKIRGLASLCRPGTLSP